MTSHHGHPILAVSVEPTCGTPAMECTSRFDAASGALEVSLRLVGDADAPCQPGRREFGACSLPAREISNGAGRYPSFASTLPPKSNVAVRCNEQPIGSLETDENGRAVAETCLTIAAPPRSP